MGPENPADYLTYVGGSLHNPKPRAKSRGAFSTPPRGRKPSPLAAGRVQYATRLSPRAIAFIVYLAHKAKRSNQDVLEALILGVAKRDKEFDKEFENVGT